MSVGDPWGKRVRNSVFFKITVLDHSIWADSVKMCGLNKQKSFPMCQELHQQGSKGVCINHTALIL